MTATDIDTKRAKKTANQKASEAAELSTMRAAVVTVRGVTPLLPHKFAEKTGSGSQLAMLRDHMGAKKEKKSPKIPVADAIASLYVMGDPIVVPQEYLTLSPDEIEHRMELPFLRGFTRFGIKASGFKKAVMRAGKGAGLVMVDLGVSMWIHTTDTEGLLRVDVAGTPLMRFDMAPVQRKMDTRFRVELPDWSVTFRIEYDQGVIRDEQLLNLLSRAGKLVGIGDWRNEKGGTFGAFVVESIMHEVPA